MEQIVLLDLGPQVDTDLELEPPRPVNGKRRKGKEPRPVPHPAPVEDSAAVLIPPPGCYLAPILGMMPSIMLEDTGGATDPERLRQVRLYKRLGLVMGFPLPDVLNRMRYTWNDYLAELPEMCAADAEAYLKILLSRDVLHWDPTVWNQLKPKEQEKAEAQERRLVRRLVGYFRASLRWDYWLSVHETGQAPAGPIPRFEFIDAYQDSEVVKMWRKAAQVFERAGFTGGRAMDMLIEMILYGFCERPDLPSGVEDRVWAQAFETFDLGMALSSPTDALGVVLPEMVSGKGHGFFPTPLNVSRMMVEMVMAGRDEKAKTESFHPAGHGTFSEPAAGTGVMLLLASNYTLDVSGVELVHQIYRALLANCWLYTPWAVAPLKVWQGNSLIPPDMWTETPEAQTRAARERRRTAWEARQAWFVEHEDRLIPAEYVDRLVAELRQLADTRERALAPASQQPAVEEVIQLLAL